MKAVHIKDYGDIDKLNWGEVPDPIEDKKRIIVKIKASAINHLDIWIRKGIPGHKINDLFILGSDASGEIINVGSKVEGYKIGDKVVIQPGIFKETSKKYDRGKEHYSQSYGIIGETVNGVQSEYFSCLAENLCIMPKHFNFHEAASMPLVFMTAYEMLIARANLNKDDIVLVYGATSGVGSAAIQIAKDIGCEVFTTVGDKKKMDFAYSLGAKFVFNHRSASFYQDVLKELNGHKIDVIFEHIGKATWDSSLKLMSRGGRLVTCGATTGNIVNINLTHLFFKNQTILGSTMGSLKTFQLVMEKISDKKYTPIIDEIVDIKDIKYAHDKIEKGLNLGKVILNI